MSHAPRPIPTDPAALRRLVDQMIEDCASQVLVIPVEAAELYGFNATRSDIDDETGPLHLALVARLNELFPKN